jgi:hypothetical protein
MAAGSNYYRNRIVGLRFCSGYGAKDMLRAYYIYLLTLIGLQYAR